MSIFSIIEHIQSDLIQKTDNWQQIYIYIYIYIHIYIYVYIYHIHIYVSHIYIYIYIYICINFYTSNSVCVQSNELKRKNISSVILNKLKHVSLYKSVEIHTSAKADGVANNH